MDDSSLLQTTAEVSVTFTGFHQHLLGSRHPGWPVSARRLVDDPIDRDLQRRTRVLRRFAHYPRVDGPFRGGALAYLERHDWIGGSHDRGLHGAGDARPPAK